MIAFIDDHRGAYGVEPICKVLPIAPSTYYAQVARRADPTKRSARARSDAALTIEIRRVFDGNFHPRSGGLAPRPRPAAAARDLNAGAVCPGRSRSPQPPAPLCPTIPHLAEAETNLLANNNHYALRRFNTQCTLFTGE